LNGYLLWVEQWPPESHDRLGELKRFLGPFGFPSDTSQSSLLNKQERDDGIHHQLEALAGTYQVLRPHSSLINCYILELLSIAIAGSGSAVMRMYSHNDLRHTYEGEFLIDDPCGFSLLRRPNETSTAPPARRCVSIYTGDRQESWGDFPYACLSGLLLRGVAGHVRPDRATSSPFVALKHFPAIDIDLTIPKFEEPVHRTSRWSDHPHLVVGEIRGRTFGYDFCSKLFELGKDKLGNKLLSGLTLQTILPDEIADALNIDPSIDGSYFNAWSAAMDSPPSQDAEPNMQPPD
jgi:hypothetical protein